MFCAIFYLEANEGLEGAYVSHLTVTLVGLFDGFHRLSDRGEGCSNILAIWVCAAGKGMVFKPFTLG